jgi:hypothetical protein
LSSGSKPIRNLIAFPRVRNCRRRNREAAWKQAVFGLLEHNTKDGKKSKVRAHVVPESWMKPVNDIIRETVEPGSNIL